MNFFKSKFDSKEYLDLKQDISSLKIELHELELDFALIVKKLKVKYKISRSENTEEEETKGLNNPVLLPE